MPLIAVVVVRHFRCKMKIAFQMDHISTINQSTDSTYMLIKEAARLGFELFHYTPKDLYLDNGKVYAQVEHLAIYPNQDKFYQLSAQQKLDLTELDFLFIRQDPPFDLAYITNSYILEKIRHKIIFINDPTAIRNAPEKILVCDYKEFTPNTIITENLQIIRDFAQKYPKIILKPLYACGGEGVVKLQAPYDDLISEGAKLINYCKTPIIAQEYLAEIKQGDLRVIIACGQIMGRVLRVPEPGKVAANFHAGGKAVKAKLSAKQKEIALYIGQILLEKKLYFAGLDFIGDYLTEINITSPTGIQEINQLEGKNIEQEIWQNFLKLK